MSTLMAEQPLPTKPSTPPPPRVAVQYAIEGDLRFLAHHDEMKLLARALVRARWPVAFSRGFNPLPRVSIALPRPVGVSSTAQLAVVVLSEPSAVSELAARLRAALPRGCTLCDVAPLPPKRKPHAVEAEYVVALSSVRADELSRAIERVLGAESLPVERGFGPGKPARTVDVRRFLTNLEHDGAALRFALQITPTGAARPAEILQALGLTQLEHWHHIRLTQVRWDHPPTGPASGPAARKD